VFRGLPRGRSIPEAAGGRVRETLKLANKRCTNRLNGEYLEPFQSNRHLPPSHVGVGFAETCQLDGARGGMLVQECNFAVAECVSSIWQATYRLIRGIVTMATFKLSFDASVRMDHGIDHAARGKLHISLARNLVWISLGIGHFHLAVAGCRSDIGAVSITIRR